MQKMKEVVKLEEMEVNKDKGIFVCATLYLKSICYFVKHVLITKLTL
jgi:hypothetical protein